MSRHARACKERVEATPRFALKKGDGPGARLRVLIENHGYDRDLRARAARLVAEWKGKVRVPEVNDAAAAGSDLRVRRVPPVLSLGAVAARSRSRRQ